MKKIPITVNCSIDRRDKVFYFNIDEDGNPWPNYCDDQTASKECQQCAVSSLKTLIAKTENFLSSQSTIT